MKKWFYTVDTALTFALCLIIIFSFCGCTLNNKTDSNDKESQSDNPVVQVISMDSDTTESSFRVGVNIQKSSFSTISQRLTDLIDEEWKKYDGMTEEAKMISSHSFGNITFEVDEWKEFEDAIGTSVLNPLENINWMGSPAENTNWLNKTGYIGMESTDPNTPIKHIAITLDAANEERDLREISAAAGYNTVNARITLTATLISDTAAITSDTTAFSSDLEMLTTGCVYNGNAAFDHSVRTTGSGIPVLVVTADMKNNTGYYKSVFYEINAYWTKENVFYTLRILGDSADRDEIDEALNKILEGI